MQGTITLILGALSIVTLAPSGAAASPTCAQLGTNPAHGLAGNPQISGLTAAIIPAAGANVAYCQVDFTLSTESGPAAGYRVGQSEQLKIRIGLPLNIADGGTGGVQGAWNGKNRDLGGGGYAGAVGGVTSSTNRGYVGTSTDTGHSTADGGSFALNSDKTLNWGLIRDFARDGIHDAHIWGMSLAKAYYAMEPSRKYWMGCSTGGRQGHYLAQNFPNDFDGILGGAPAFNWDRFIPSELWPQIVMNQELGASISAAKLTSVTNAAVAACDKIDGIADGIVEDPRKCHYDARSLVCAGAPGDPANCLTAAEAAAVNKIWDGPAGGGGQAWYGLERGASLAGLAGASPFPIAVDHFKYWIKQDPAFDWHTVTETSFLSDFVTSVEKFNAAVGTDDADLGKFRSSGAKMITYHGLFDQLIFPRGTYNYYNAVKGGIKETQKYYRFFPYPNTGHCGGGSGPQIDAEALFSALVNWVENGIAPDYIVAKQSLDGGAVRTRKICKYPDVQVYNGSGSTDDDANFHCQVRDSDDRALLKRDEIDKRFQPKH